MIRLGADICTNLDQAVTKEWVETNGLGGFAGSTIAGLNTRRYHGLLVAAIKPPVGRLVLLSKMEEVLVVDGQRYDLSANRYPGAVYPQGYRLLKEFRLDPFPKFVYEVDGVELEKSVFLVHGENTAVVEYRLSGINGRPDCRLELRPLIAFRDYHSLTRANDGLDPRVAEEPGFATVAPYGDLPPLHFGHEADGIEPYGGWYFNFEYGVERERGLDFTEDLFNPLTLHYNLTDGRSIAVVASTERRGASAAAEFRRSEIERRRNIADSAPVQSPFVRQLALAADQFLVRRGGLTSVIAGYPWFGDWGRDTMIALPGLALATGQPEIAKNILLAFAAHVSEGMLPNRFPDAGEAPEYNTVDASLWFFEAIRAYLQYTGDRAFVRNELYGVLRGMIDWHERGTRYGIRMDSDGLLNAGEPGVQLTWMDAKVGDWVVTPRHGKPVEIQALWYNALMVMRGLAERFDDPAGAERFAAMAAKASDSFNAQFWNEELECLFDVVGEGRPDGSIRPNQIFAVSLPYVMLSPDRARAVVEKVRQELLTPAGLRSLARGDSQYRPIYQGDVPSRDGAYHQGTVWPWLLGPFVTAYVKVHNGSAESRREAEAFLAPLEEHLCDAGLGQISEIFDAEPPHLPRGCFAQAWSVSELLHAIVQDLGRPDAAGDGATGSGAILRLEPVAASN